MPERNSEKTDCYLYDKGSDFKIIRYTRGCSTTKKTIHRRNESRDQSGEGDTEKVGERVK